MPREGGLKTVKRLMKKRPGAKILILTTYDTDEEKDAAGKAVKRVYGVRGIANDIEVKLFWQRTDPEIARDAVRELESHVSIPVDKIRVTVKDGWVTLEGTVDWEYQKRLANWTALASSTPLISGIATSASTRLISGRFAIVRNASLALRRGRRETYKIAMIWSPRTSCGCCSRSIRPGKYSSQRARRLWSVASIWSFVLLHTTVAAIAAPLGHLVCARPLIDRWF
jgi:BON domain